MKAVVLVVVLLVFAAIVSLALTERKLVTHKTEIAVMKFNLNGLPEHGISLIAPSDPILTRGRIVSVDPYSVVRNTGSRAVVGYAVKWECFDGKGEVIGRDTSKDHILSNILGIVFMYGEESERKTILSQLDGVIEPNSTWLISRNFPAHPIGVTIENGNAEVPTLLLTQFERRARL